VITHIHVSGFKSICDLHLDVSPCTVLVGRSGSGKTHLLEAVTLVKRTLESGVRDATQGSGSRFDPATLFHRTDGVPADLLSVRVELTAPLAETYVPLAVQLAARRAADGGLVLHREYSNISVRPGADKAVAALLGTVDLDVPDSRDTLAVLAWDALKGFDVDATDPDAPGTDSALADSYLRLSLLERTTLSAHVAALVSGGRSVRLVSSGSERRLEVEVTHVGWLPLASLSRFERVAVAALLVALDGHVVCVDDLGAGAPRDRAEDLFRRLRGLCDPGQVLAVSAQLGIADPSRLGTGGLVFFESATRSGGGLPLARSILARPVRKRGPEEGLDSAASPRCVERAMGSR